MIIERLKDPRASNAEIIKRAGYKAKDVHTASQQYVENMKKPEIASRLADVSDEMEDTLITTVRQFKSSEKIPERSLAVNTAMWVHDKIHGKATQRIESHNTSVKLSLSLKDISE